ncbi:rolling circle replication-associated protein [Chromobacterium violaceum]|uniref:Replication-associated protein ORF2/G2P domain-containing protein n=1 Tax=Chromobacterium violaceum TaxID=536 RepID=A0AAX2M6C7_CHRVL|nr:hypothetical protein [Chromobacterium violaceum]STB64255.1 Uncharacterised protein [Chromobacterium violaceum]SUX31969.1 Uncharacterised protein [Chromobacterium violaceum]
MSQLFLAGHRPAPRIVRSAELVNKNKTSAALSLRKRKKAARKKLKLALKEQRRYAKANNLRAVAVTLTYADNAQFEPKHISAFLDPLRRALKRLGHSLPYVWTLEYEGRLHYHLMLWLPRDYKLDPVKIKRWWPWGCTWVENCRSPGAWGRYITKFDSAPKLPKGARLFGYGGLDVEGRAAVLRTRLPKWLCSLLPPAALVRKAAGGGWVNMETGEWYPSPYIWTPRGIVLRTATTLVCHPVA